jgi:26S proteasome regulatory subunit N1
VDALRVALRLDDESLVHMAFTAASADPLEKRQMGYLLGRQSRWLNLEEGPCAVEDETLRTQLQEAISNTRLSEHYLALARDLDVMEAKVPEDVYKMHLVNTPTSSSVDSARANLASTFVNAFLNAGFGQDKLMMAGSSGGGAAAAEETAAAGGSGGAKSSSDVHWIFKNKDHGKMSATASLGLITLWDVEGGLPQLDKYLYSSDNYVVAGALLGVGIVNSGVRSEMDPAYALLFESVNKSNPQIRQGAIMGLGLAYAGTNKEEVQELLFPVVMDPETPVEVAAYAALSLGLVFVGSMHEECTTALLQALMTRSEAELSEPLSRFFCLGLGLLFLGRQDLAEATIEVRFI